GSDLEWRGSSIESLLDVGIAVASDPERARFLEREENVGRWILTVKAGPPSFEYVDHAERGELPARTRRTARRAAPRGRLDRQLDEAQRPTGDRFVDARADMRLDPGKSEPHFEPGPLRLVGAARDHELAQLVESHLERPRTARGNADKGNEAGNSMRFLVRD